MIQVDGLTKFYGDFCAVDHIRFEINKGEILGLLGPNGAGKTTTLRMLTCYLSPTEGTARFWDYNIKDNPLEIKNRVGYLSESAPIYPDMLVYDYLEYVAELRGIGKTKREARIRELADTCGLNTVMHRAVGELSKGFKQRVGLAHAMMGDPEVLILDEPTSGLDPNQIIEIRELIKRLGREKTVVLSSHILSEVEATCNRVVIINKGRIAADGSIDELKKSASGKVLLRVTLKNADFGAFEAEMKTVVGVVQVQRLDAPEGEVSAMLECAADTDVRPAVYGRVKSKDWVVLEFVQESKTLENIFRDLTREGDALPQAQ